MSAFYVIEELHIIRVIQRAFSAKVRDPLPDFIDIFVPQLVQVEDVAEGCAEHAEFALQPVAGPLAEPLKALLGDGLRLILQISQIE